MTAAALRMLLASDHVTHIPGVYDPVTAALAVRAGHRAVHLSGAAVSAIALGRPDLDYGHGTQIADRASTLMAALDGVPLLADADAGYTEPTQAVWTALAYVRAGVSGLHLDDQIGPHRGGSVSGDSSSGREIVDISLAAARISALAEQVPDLTLIATTKIATTKIATTKIATTKIATTKIATTKIATTKIATTKIVTSTAYDQRGLAATVERCRAYAESGADAVHPAGVQSLEELATLHRELPGVPLVISRSETGGSGTGGRAPLASDAQLADVGVRLVLHPVAALLAAMRAASLTYRAIAEGGSADPVDRMPWAAFTALNDHDAPDARYVPGNLET